MQRLGSRPVVTWVSASLVVGFAWLASGLRPFTLPALAAVLGGGLLVIVTGDLLPGPSTPARGRPAGPPWTWAALAGAAALWELQAFLQHPRDDHPTISSLTNDLFQGHHWRAIAMLLWLAAGVWLARR